MIQRIIAYSVQNKLLVGLFVLSIIGLGLWSMKQVPIDAVPDITNNQVQIITQSPNLGTTDVEQFLTYPIELAMANLPGVVEMRSTSRFGLSIVTIVFEENMGTYLPRQLINEQLTEVANDIPETYGKPFIGPISTGLGEIYQYTLEVDTGHYYSPRELRIIQDWIVRRQMAMVPGVVEVNAFGGLQKEYEVSYNPDRLNSMGVSIHELHQALIDNNGNTGSAYIEKNHRANYIRGEGLARSISDIEEIFVKTENGIPLTVKDLAEVRIGDAIRYGAFTKNGTGEAVGGTVMMLKGANSNEVINSIHARVNDIQESLPEGVSIVPFLDRSKLINATTSTVRNNLVEGAIIVIFILVLLLGNWRGGLIVASTIPLSLLFAFMLMHAFDVWANLMSLGAIDFGIIVDGAVIIVEGSVFAFREHLFKKGTLKQTDRDRIAVSTSSNMMRSAFFGQLIILLVFVPILGLQGIEGKMFKPMALTFMFAILGAMVLCLTYVPMISSLVIKVSPEGNVSLGDKLIKFIETGYQRLFNVVFKWKKAVILGAVSILVVSIGIFARLGGEFIPQLNEGDLAFHIILKPGSALSESIKSTTMIEKMLLEEFSEVEAIYSRIGVSDVPTDPMPMDVADCFAILKPESEWNSGRSREDLVRDMNLRVKQLPSLNFEFSQPIEMRFNELISGVREDIAIKIYGDELPILASKAEEISSLIQNIDGVGDLHVESTKGMPQLAIQYDRSRLAQYGISVAEVNEIVQSAVGGAPSGVIFEGERRFDLVLRMKSDRRQGIEGVSSLYIPLPNDGQVPLSMLADISYQTGPMQISRDNTNRRTYVGVNVRGRDVQSVVRDIQKEIDSQLDLPSGYYIQYGGAFKNLQRATERLNVLIPIALVLIFVLIFLALKSLINTVMIYLAIPFSAVGGVIALWIRGMPFSISAGVGFVVLFGVAVLNGLVLINSWKDLKSDRSLLLVDRIKQGTTLRIRPILLTALTDILGFLPMAISTSAGAEVQQPLATVVIGGMVSATLLTLFVLPLLYYWIERARPIQFNTAIVGVIMLIGVPSLTQAQQAVTSLDEVLSLAKQNGFVQAAKIEAKRAEAQVSGSLDFDKLSINTQYGQYNSYEQDFAVEISQSFAFPTTYIQQHRAAKVNAEKQKHLANQQLLDIQFKIALKWYVLASQLKQLTLAKQQDSIYQSIAAASQLRFEAERGTYLETITAKSSAERFRTKRYTLEQDILISETELKALLHDSSGTRYRPADFEKQVELADSSSYPAVHAVWSSVEQTEANLKASKAKALPDLTVGYFNQSMVGAQLKEGGIANVKDRFQGVQAGIAIPLFFQKNSSDIKSQQLATEQATALANQVTLDWQLNKTRALLLQQQASQLVDFYQNLATEQANTIEEQALIQFQEGRISFIEMGQYLTESFLLREQYITALLNYHQAHLYLSYLNGSIQ